MARMSIREYARHRGVSHTAVQKAVKTGRVAIEADVDGAQFIDSDAADASWEQLTDKAMQRGRSRDDDGFEDDDDALPGATVSPNDPKGYASSHARREFFKAGLVELEYRRVAGELVSAEEVRANAFKVSRFVRDGVIAAVDRLAPTLVGATDIGQIHERLTNELTRALSGLSDLCGSDE